MTDSIHLGFEVGTGKPVAVPLKHMAVTGQTQESGKTTTLEALVSRLEPGTAALTFITKRGESAFQGGDALGVRWEVRPYFRDRADWQFVDSLLSAQLQEKNKFLRPWIMKICRTTRTLSQVHDKVKDALRTAKGIHEGVYTQLDAYLDLIVPEIRRATLAGSLDIQPGLNVMDVSAFATPMQMLFVQSALDFVNAHCASTIVVIPEAWEMVPEGKGSPVKASAVTLVRKGAAIGNLIWVDSQDMAGVDKVILRGCTVWLIGVQREANEIKRNLSNIPHGTAKPTAAQVALLERGQFYACWGQHCVKTYVQPAWMASEMAVAIAKGNVPVGSWRPAPLPPTKKRVTTDYEEARWHDAEEAQVKESEARELREENEQLKDALAAVEKQAIELQEKLTDVERKLSGRNGPEARVVEKHPGEMVIGDEALYLWIRDRLSKEAPKLLKVLLTKQELEVEVQVETVTMDGASWVGRVARLIVDGFFKTPRKSSVVYAEAMRLGASGVAPRADEACKKLLVMGFLTREADGFREVPGMKINIKKS